MVNNRVNGFRDDLINMLNDIHGQLNSKPGCENDLMLY